MKPSEITVNEDKIKENWLARTGILGKGAQGAAMLARQRELSSQIGSSDFNKKLEMGLSQAIASGAVDKSNTTLLSEAFGDYAKFTQLVESLIVNEALGTGMSVAEYVLRFVKNQINLEKLPQPVEGSNDEKILKDLANTFQSAYIAPNAAFPTVIAGRLFGYLQHWESTNARMDPYSSLGGGSSNAPTNTSSKNVNSANIIRAINLAQFPVINAAGAVTAAPRDNFNSLIIAAVIMLVEYGVIDKSIITNVINSFESGKRTPVDLTKVDKTKIINSLTSSPVDGADNYKKLTKIAALVLRYIYQTAEASSRGLGSTAIDTIKTRYSSNRRISP